MPERKSFDIAFICHCQLTIFETQGNTKVSYLCCPQDSIQQIASLEAVFTLGTIPFSLIVLLQ